MQSEGNQHQIKCSLNTTAPASILDIHADKMTALQTLSHKTLPNKEKICRRIQAKSITPYPHRIWRQHPPN
jgi:hypothetical protein